ARLTELLEQHEEALDVGLPGEGSSVYQLGEVALSHGAHLQQALAHEVEPLTGTSHGGELLRALAVHVARPADLREARVRDLEASAGSHDPYPVRVEEERGRDTARTGGHGVADALEVDQSGGADLHREAQPVLG